MKPIPLIIDADPGVDDALAMKIAFDSPALDIRLVCTGVEIVFAPMHRGRVARLAEADILARGRGSDFGAMLEEIFRDYQDRAAGEGYVAMYDANVMEAILHPELYDFVRCSASVDTGAHPGQTFLRPDANGRLSYLEIRDADAVARSMLNDLFPG